MLSATSVAPDIRVEPATVGGIAGCWLRLANPHPNARMLYLHWEGDLLCGSKNSNIVTWVERHSRYVMLAKVPNRETQTVVNALIKQARHLPRELYKSLTWDRGKELSDHQRFTMETDIAVYFGDPLQ